MGRLAPSPVWKAAVSVQTASADREVHALHMQSMKRYRFMKSPAPAPKVRSGAKQNARPKMTARSTSHFGFGNGKTNRLRRITYLT